MQLVKRNIESSVVKASARGKFTLDKDFNVPDTKADIERIVMVKGNVTLEESECMVDRVKVKGVVTFWLLYTTVNSPCPLCRMEGTLPFMETVHMEGVLPTDQCHVELENEDLSISLVNSRKVLAKALVGYALHTCGQDVVEVATGLENGSGFECLFKDVSYAKLVVDTKDIFRIRQELPLPQAKPNIGELVWYSVNVDHINTKPETAEVKLSGSLSVFAIYRAEDEGQPLQFFTTDIPFDGGVEVPEASQDMVSAIETNLANVEAAVRPDADGESRILEVSAAIHLGIRIYEDAKTQILEDLFAPSVELIEHKETFGYESILMKNAAQMRVSERIHLNRSQERILQICQVEGSVKIDEEQIVEEGLQVEGVVLATILYISANDTHPVSAMEAMIPFMYVVEMQNLTEKDRYEIKPELCQLSGIMISGEEVEVKAQVNLNIIAFTCGKMEGIGNIEVQPLAYEKKKALPAMAGYIVKEGDTLWNVAKRYYTTLDLIREINHLENDTLAAGQKLLIVKG